MSILVLDCGSSALKATLFAETGSILAQEEVAYPPQPVLHRISPKLWWQAAVAAVQRLSPHDVAAIAMTGAMENLIPVGEGGGPTADALLYSDPCGTPYLEAMTNRLGASGAIAGNAPEPLMTAFKLAWLREHEPEAAGRALTFLPGAKDYLVLQMTGVPATDASCAATTGLMDIVARDWSPELLDLHGVHRNSLPAILPAGDIVGSLRPEAAQLFGLPAGIPVINGCGDGAATTLGSGAQAANDVSIYLGTSGWVARVAPAAGTAPRPYYRLPHPLHDGVIEIAPILSAGAAARWARSALSIDTDAADALAVGADANPGGALFLPYLSGERSPFLDLDLRAGFVGLAVSDGPGELYYAVLEGVAFAIAANIDAMGAAGEISLVGGGAKSPVWAQVLADVLGASVTVPSDPVAASSLGAFRLAAHALGLPVDFAAEGRVWQPRPDRQGRIRRQRARFVAATGFLRTI